MNIVIAGLSITSAWGNGHATTYRSLIAGLVQGGHNVLFLERDVPWYAANRDLPCPPFGRTELYTSIADLQERFPAEVGAANLVIVGSYVPEGSAVADWVLRTAQGVTAFFDIDTPVTLRKLRQGDYEYLTPELIPRFDLYLSFAGGRTLTELERQYGARRARALYCSVDPSLYFAEAAPVQYDLGYLGTYSADRQPTLEELLLAPARLRPEGRFVVAGPMYPNGIDWPHNVIRIDHLAPDQHRRFYNAQRYTLNVTRADMIEAGYSPSVRLFEAAACGTPVISDNWEGLESFFTPGKEILVARNSGDVRAILRDVAEEERRQIGERARRRVLESHTAAHRAGELVRLAGEVRTTASQPA